MLDKFNKSELFDGVTLEYLESLETECTERDLKANEYLFRQGDTGKGMFLIVEGKIDIITETGVDNIVATIGAGSILGEVCMLERQKRIASARAKTDAKLLYLSIKKFAEHIKHNDPNALRIIHNIALSLIKKLESANELLSKIQGKTSQPMNREVSKYKEKLLKEGLF